MSAKAKIRIALDVVMTLALLVVSGYQLWGDAAQEWVGAGLFALFIAHNLMNLAWYKTLFKGKYTPRRVVQLALNLLLLLSMLAQMYSGILLSRHVFAFLPIEGGLALARQLHILGAYWGYLLMALHLGLHWMGILSMLRKAAGLKAPTKMRAVLGNAAGLALSAYGVYALIQRGFPTYLLLRSEFVFLDYSEPALAFYADYLAIMALCVFAGHWAAKLCARAQTRKEKSQ